ncbi:SAM dependent carboxyl methyltransferase [Penicillium capsulatum]|uniref:SAM dependent carboxyl methyltransferase n=1 Tax=Penicillium capsulatum TaxID=69766 RepID=A0A9W9IMJ5_9EURO|nr:SAM dependent carboxyl methyltransferase [Penicillium capsulatum]KAJ6122298.1 SAM dependent carboxyl methyltransferase [Penicillium capsulatum]
MASVDPLNDVVMQGEGAYKAHSELQYAAMLKALPLLEKAAQEIAQRASSSSSDRLVTVAEYGAAHGNNSSVARRPVDIHSIKPLETIRQSISPTQLQVLLNDRVGNDFNTLAATIAEWTQGIAAPPFVGMVPGSFYDQVLPPSSVDLGFSFTSLQHLDRTPRTADENLVPVPNAAELISAQSHSDFCSFLRQREIEMTPGSSLVLCFPMTSSSGRENLAGPTAAIYTATKEMVMQGLLAKEVIAGFQRPTHDRTMEEVHRSLGAVGDAWVVRDVFEDSVLHPAIDALSKEKELNGPSEAASVEYADAVIEWLVAVLAGFFLKSVKLVDPGCTAEQEGVILVEWTTRMKRVFLRDYRDEEVFMSFAYIWLQRAT